MIEKRTSPESRLTMLEYRMSEIERDHRETREQHEQATAAIMEKLSEIKSDQDKVKTIIGGAAFLASGAIAAAWWFIQSVFVKVFHD
jgi:hypothetical protein